MRLIDQEYINKTVKEHYAFNDLLYKLMDECNPEIKYVSMGDDYIISLDKYIEKVLEEYVSAYFDGEYYWEIGLEEFLEKSWNQEVHEDMVFLTVTKKQLSYQFQ